MNSWGMEREDGVKGPSRTLLFELCFLSVTVSFIVRLCFSPLCEVVFVLYCISLLCGWKGGLTVNPTSPGGPHGKPHKPRGGRTVLLETRETESNHGGCSEMKTSSLKADRGQ